jgi:hypothetical protein
MLISMSKAAGAPDPSRIFIGTALEEAQGIKSESGRIQWHIEERPWAQKVLQELHKYNVLHACCHGISDPENPGNSHLELYKKVTNPEHDPENIEPPHRLANNLSKIQKFRFGLPSRVFNSRCASLKAARRRDTNRECFPACWVSARGTYPVVGCRSYLSHCGEWAYHFLASWTEEEPMAGLHDSFALQFAVVKARMRCGRILLFNFGQRSYTKVCLILRNFVTNGL